MHPQTPHDPQRAAIIEDLTDALRLFNVETDVFVEVFARAHGLGRNDLDAIMWISEGTHNGRPISAGELANRLGLGAPATTGLLDRLEKAGHVRRERDPNDRRKVTVVMQPPALHLAMAFFEPLGRLMHDAVADISPQDLQRTATVVRLLVNAVTQARHTTAKP